jgi:hypothetical protein
VIVVQTVATVVVVIVMIVVSVALVQSSRLRLPKRNNSQRTSAIR